jgi:NitT/TauT family transport system ATP-binding protein
LTTVDVPGKLGGAVGDESTSQSVAIRVQGLSKTFTLDGRDLQALADVDLSIMKGEFCSIIGPSGCGKSTLLRLIADVVSPSTGIVEVLGHPPRQARMARKLGFVFQEPALLPWRTALENVELPLRVAGVPRAERAARARALLELVGLADFGRARPAQLSGGMASRVAIARGLVLEPPILLLDEPFGALDEITRQRLNLELQRIWSAAQGTTAALVTHNVGEAVFLSDRVFVMTSRPGRIAAEVRINLRRPRTLELLQDADFFDYQRRLTRILYGHAEALAELDTMGGPEATG